MKQLTPTVGGSGVTVTLAPDELIPSGFDSSVPMVGYLVLAPVGTPIEDLFAARSQQRPADPPDVTPLGARATAPFQARDPEGPGGRDGPNGPNGPNGRDGRDGVTVDADRRIATVDGRVLSLTYLEFELLAFLLSNPQRVYSRGQLVGTIWGYGPVGDERTVDVHVARLRRKLGPRYRQRIVTVRRVGYKYCPTA